MPMNNRLLRPRQTTHPEAAAWKSAVVANGGTVSGTTFSDVDKFCKAIASAGIRDRFYRLNLFAGTGLNAALVPIYRNYRLFSGRNEIQGEVFSGWTLSSATVVSSAAAAPAAAPAGAPLASSFKEATTASATPHTMSVQYTATGAGCVVSAYIKPDGRDWVLFSVEDAGGNPFAYAYYNLAGMATGSAFAGATNSTITDAGNGWARISFRCTPTAGTRFIRMFSSTANASNQTVGDATKGYLIWGFQLEYGTTLTAYDSRPLGNTTDTNVGPFVSGDYVETGASGGLTGNGTSKYLFTGLTTSALPQIATGHLSVYAATYPTASIHGLLTSWGSGYGDPLYVLESNRNGAGNLLQAWGNNFPAVNISTGTGTGLLMTSRTGGTSLKAYRNGSQIGSTSTTSITPAANNGGGFGVFANAPQAGVAANYFPGRLGGYSIGAGMSDAEAAAYYTAMQAFQTALGRNV